MVLSESRPISPKTVEEATTLEPHSSIPFMEIVTSPENDHNHQYMIEDSSPPAQGFVPLEPPIQGMARRLALDSCTLQNELLGLPSSEFIWSEPANVHWEPDSDDFNTVIDLAARAHSFNSYPQLQENWEGRAELTFQHSTTTMKQDAMTQYPIRLDSISSSTTPFIYNRSSSPPTQQSSHTVLVQRLRQKASELLSAEREVKRTSFVEESRMDTDAFLDSSILELSDSSIPEAISCASQTSDSENESTCVNSSRGNSPNAIERSRTKRVPGLSDLKKQSQPRMRAIELAGEEVDSLVSRAIEQASYKPLLLSPFVSLIPKGSSRAEMLEAMDIGKEALMKPVRGQLRCSPSCRKLSKTLMELATHIDQNHDREHRPVKCPYSLCVWHVLGFHDYPQCGRHIRAQHSQEVYQCDACSRANRSDTVKFNRVDALRRHLRSVHGRSEEKTDQSS